MADAPVSQASAAEGCGADPRELVGPVEPVEPLGPVAVRVLCEFAAKAGDLDLRFTPSPTAQDGMLGHKLVTARRAAGYESEITLSGHWKQLQVRGRADGYDPQANRLEEIKTHRGDLAAMKANHRALHWAQARIYGWLLCEARGLATLEVALVYHDIGTQRETVLTEAHTADSLRAFFEATCERFLGWALREAAHRRARDEGLARLAFPHADFRPGQRELAEAVYRAAAQGRCLLAQAPTGIGKTVGTLFPLLKAVPGQRLDKVYFLAARTTGRRLALDALDRLAPPDSGRPLRVLELTAREKACEHPDKACHGESCPLAQGFYDRLGAAREAAADAQRLDAPTLRAIARTHAVCPYYLAQEMARWADVVVGDYNYYFDGSAMLYALAVSQEWRVGVLVDEAHNLVDRARAMYSASLVRDQLGDARKRASAPVRKALDKLHRAWGVLQREQVADYQVHEELPAAFRHALAQAVAALADDETVAGPAADPQLQECMFALMQFARLAEQFGRHSLLDLTLTPPVRGRQGSTLCLRNVVPAPFLEERLGAARTLALFSATLRPQAYYTDLLGLPASTVAVDVASPFHARQLQVRVARHISTRYAHRTRSLAPLVALIARQWQERPGNYLAFLSSYDYLEQVADALQAAQPGIPVWRQERAMSEAGRDAFLARFVEDGCGIGFAVLGGAFAEGIDLPGRRLIGAFVATLGLPQVNPVNEQMKQRMAEVFGAASGYDYAFLYPGVQKVVQAAGRVIRTPDDEGVLHLMDDRFARPDVRALLPSWWSVETFRQRLQPDVSAAPSYTEAPTA
jgi:Rad3-related DNA helicase